jgi:hypothetical protein
MVPQLCHDCFLPNPHRAERTRYAASPYAVRSALGDSEARCSVHWQQGPFAVSNGGVLCPRKDWQGTGLEVVHQC